MTFSDDRGRIYPESRLMGARSIEKHFDVTPTNVAPPISIPPDDDPGQVGSPLAEKVAPRSLSAFFPQSQLRIPPSVPRISRGGDKRVSGQWGMFVRGESEIEGGRSLEGDQLLNDARPRDHGSDPVQDIRPGGPHGRGPLAPRQGQ